MDQTINAVWRNVTFPYVNVSESLFTRYCIFPILKCSESKHKEAKLKKKVILLDRLFFFFFDYFKLGHE